MGRFRSRYVLAVEKDFTDWHGTTIRIRRYWDAIRGEWTLVSEMAMEYGTRDEAEAVAFLLTIQCPERIGEIQVRHRPEWKEDRNEEPDSRCGGHVRGRL